MSANQSTTSKRCIGCGVEKPSGDFSAEPRNRDGLQGRCRACRQAARPVEANRPASYVMPASKACRKCGVDKPLAEYSPDRRSWDGRQSRCMQCGNDRYRAKAASPDGRAMIAAWEVNSKIKHRYGITADEYARLLTAQDGVCAICGRPPSGGVRNRRLHVDHCHATGKVRGLLCSQCNQALGTFGDDLDGIMKVVAYLRRSP